MKRFPLLLLMTLSWDPAAATTAAAADGTVARQHDRYLAVLRDGLAAHGNAFWPAMHAAEALSQMGLGEEVTAALKPLEPTVTDDQQRCGVAREMARAGDRAKTARLWEILNGTDDHGHVHAAESLFKVGWEQSADAAPLRRALHQTGNARLRMMAAAALARHEQDADALQVLRQGLAHEADPDLLFLYAWGLGQVGGPTDVEPIRRRLKDLVELPWQRSFLEHALARLGDAEGRAAVLRNLNAPDVRIITYAAETAGAAGLMEAAPRLMELLSHSDLDTRIRAAQALLLLSPPVSVKAPQP